MKRYCFELGMLKTNCYLLENEHTRRAVVIDPGDSASTIIQFLSMHALELDAIFLTHGHFDHTGGLRGLHAATNARVYLHPDDEHLDSHLSRENLIVTDHFADGQDVTQAGMTFHVLSTPGHSPGSVCLLVDELLFSGDTLFAGTCGRTDLAGGDYEKMMSSLRRLAALPGNYTLLPGHGEESTLDVERAENCYLREATGE